jgi:L-alanine dehydrogenase (EC 1.4.1.1)
METALIGADAIRSSTPMETLIPAIEDAFARAGSDEVQMPAKSYLHLEAFGGDFRAMPAYLHSARGPAAGIKWVNSHPGNAGEGTLPSVMGVYIYADPHTGFPLAIMDGTELTMRRTGAAAGVATAHLAAPDAASLGLIGAGAQAATQAEAITTVRPIEQIIVSDVNTERAEAMAQELADLAPTRVGSTAAAAGCAVCSTLTPVRAPIVEATMLQEGAHINAMGADAPGKQELAPEILQAATVVIDDTEQAHHSGEVNVPLEEGRISTGAIAGTLTEVIAGSIPVDPTAQTVFDSTGLAIQDVATAQLVVETTDLDRHPSFDLVGVGG